MKRIWNALKYSLSLSATGPGEYFIPELIWSQPDIAIAVIDRNGILVDLNNGLRALLGYPSLDSLRGRRLGELTIERPEVVLGHSDGAVCGWRHFDGHTIRLLIWSGDTSNDRTLVLARPVFAAPPGEIGDTRQWRSLADICGDLIYIYDVQEGRTVQANKPLSGLLGYGPETVESFGGSLIPMLIHPEDFPVVKAMRDRLQEMDDEQSIEMTFRMRHKNGAYHWVHSRECVFSRTPGGRCREIVGRVQEISPGIERSIETDRVLPHANDVTAGTGNAVIGASDSGLVSPDIRMPDGEGAGGESGFAAQSPASVLIATAPAGFGLIDRNFRFLYCNSLLGRICGKDCVDIVGAPTVKIFPHQWSEMKLFCQKVLETGTPILGVEMTMPAGTEQSPTTYDVSYFPSGGQAVGFMMHDVTARKQTEQEFKEAKQRAEEASQAKDQFLAVLSHELRTPMTPVLLATKAMENDTSISAELRSRLTMIRRNVELEIRLIDDLLDLTRLTHRRLQLGNDTVNLHELIFNVADIYLVQIRAKNLVLRLDMTATQTHIRGDSSRLQQILWNLLSNSVKFTPDGGSITIHTWNSVANEIVVVLKDSGVGIEPDILPHIFDAFTQGEGGMHRRFGGLGLGLAISHALTELHRGTLKAESDGPGRGSTFTLTLPTVPTPPPASAPPVAETPKVAAAASILLVEDHAESADMIAFLLRSRGWSVTVATTLASALEIVTWQEFDVLVSDLSLPDGSGYSLLKLLREKGLQFPAIALSGYGHENDIEKSRRAGFVSHLVKPFGGEQVEDVIEKILQG